MSNNPPLLDGNMRAVKALTLSVVLALVSSACSSSWSRTVFINSASVDGGIVELELIYPSWCGGAIEEEVRLEDGRLYVEAIEVLEGVEGGGEVVICTTEVVTMPHRFFLPEEMRSEVDIVVMVPRCDDQDCTNKSFVEAPPLQN